jgi:hypothetical protein
MSVTGDDTVIIFLASGGVIAVFGLIPEVPTIFKDCLWVELVV